MTIFHKDATMGAIAKTMVTTIIDQCHVCLYHEKFLPLTYDTHIPYTTKLMIIPQYVPWSSFVKLGLTHMQFYYNF